MTEKKRASPNDCKHHWIIASPDGPSSVGTCQQCGETREFLNEITWENSAGYRGRPRKQSDADKPSAQ